MDCFLGGLCRDYAIGAIADSGVSRRETSGGILKLRSCVRRARVVSKQARSRTWGKGAQLPVFRVSEQERSSKAS